MESNLSSATTQHLYEYLREKVPFDMEQEKIMVYKMIQISDIIILDCS